MNIILKKLKDLKKESKKCKMDEIFFYDPYKKKTDIDETIHGMVSIIKKFGVTCKQIMDTTKEMNDAMQYMGWREKM
jgi:hypothetical protein